jgi:hypothetical protein
MAGASAMAVGCRKPPRQEGTLPRQGQRRRLRPTGGLPSKRETRAASFTVRGPSSVDERARLARALPSWGLDLPEVVTCRVMRATNCWVSSSPTSPAEMLSAAN